MSLVSRLSTARASITARLKDGDLGQVLIEGGHLAAKVGAAMVTNAHDELAQQLDTAREHLTRHAHELGRYHELHGELPAELDGDEDQADNPAPVVDDRPLPDEDLTTPEHELHQAADG